MAQLLTIAHEGNVPHCTGLNINSTTVGGETALFLAIRQKDEQAVQTLIRAGADVNHKNVHGDTPLMVAACLGAVNMLCILKKAGCSFDESNAKGQTALMLACFGRHATFVQALIDLGASVNKADIFGMTAIMLASQREGRLEYLNILLAAGADVNATNNDGHTPLMLASREGALGCMKRLISHDVCSNTVDENGMSASMLAAKEGHTDCLQELLIAGCDTNVRDNNGNTALILATMYARLECVKLLIKTLWETDVNVQNKEGMTALMFAAPDSHHDILHQLLMAGAYKDVQNAEGETALMISVRKGMYKSFCRLLQAGASIDVSNQDGQTPLMLAAANSDSRYVQTLMQTIKERGLFPGHYISKRDKRGNTSLMIATQRGLTENLEILIRLGIEFNKINKAELQLLVASLAGHTNCARLLVKNRDRFLNDGSDPKALVKAVVSDIVKALVGAEVNVYLRDTLGRTLLDQTDQLGNTMLMTLVASHGLDVHTIHRSNCINNICIFCEITSEFRNIKLQWLQLLINAGADLNKVNHEGKSAIMLATESKEDACDKSLTLLLAKGGNANLQDNKGETALMKSSAAGNVKHVRTLLQFGADLYLQDQRGRTALMHVAVFDEPDDRYDLRSPIAQLLADCGSDVNVQDGNGMTALMMATSKCMYKTVQTLLDCRADVNLKDHSGKTALMHVTHMDELDGDFEDYYDDFDDYDDMYGTSIFHRRVWIERNMHAPVVQKLVNHGSNVNMKDENGMTALMMACAGGKKKTVHALLECGANVNLQDHTGKTALMHFTIENDFYAEVSDDEYWSGTDSLPSVVDQLVAHGADVNMRDVKGMTAVMYAAASPGWGSHYQLSALARHHACFDLLDNEGKSALVHAIENSDPDMPYETVNILLSNNAFPKLEAANVSPVSSVSLLRCFRPESIIYRYTNSVVMTRLLVSNGIMPIKRIRHSSNFHEGNEREEWSPLLQILQQDFYGYFFSSREDLHIAKYLIANCYISSTDMVRIRSGDLPLLNEDAKNFLKEAVANPWPLVKLAQIAVSTAIGPSPGRRERILQTGLPRPIMDCLMFDRPIALLHKDWGNIPMCFDPVQYSQQPFQYRIGLLYNWPVGRFTELCDCDVCKQKEDQFRFTTIVK